MAVGHKTGGRKAGTPNKATVDIRLTAQHHTEACIRALVRGLSDPLQFVASAKVLLAYGYGAPRAALDVTVKPVYHIADHPLSPDEWAAKWADKPRSVDAPRRAAKRSR